MTRAPALPTPLRCSPTRGRGQRLFASLALLGMLLAALAPGVSQWLARSDPSPLWQSLCRQSGGDDAPRTTVAWLAAVGTDPAPDPADGPLHRLNACGYCVLQADFSGLAPTPLRASPTLEAAGVKAPARTPFVNRPIGTAALARGPPASRSTPVAFDA